MIDDTFTSADIRAIWHRRKFPVMLATLLTLGVSVALAVLLPPVYESTANILVEKQEISQDMVTSTAAVYAEEQIETIAQRVMTSEKILKFAKELNLYPEERAAGLDGEVVTKIRDGITIETISAAVRNPRSSKGGSVTIAFSLSAGSEFPEYAQSIAAKLAELFLSENERIRMALTTETSEFLAAESQRLEKTLLELETRLAEFKRINAQLLPGSLQYIQQIREKTEQLYVGKQAQLRSLNDRKSSLEARMLLLAPTDRLSVLKAELAMARERYSEIHPDVVRLKRSLEELQAGIAAGTELNKVSPGNPNYTPESAEYTVLKSEMDRINASILAGQIELNHAKGKLEEYDDLTLRAPEVEREYLALTRDYDNALAKNDELKDKQLQAELAGQLERSEKAERFTLLEPPRLPEKAVEPNRLAIVLIGIILAFGAGLSMALVLEYFDHRIYGSKQLALVMQAPPIGIIPDIDAAVPRHHRHHRRTAA